VKEPYHVERGEFIKQLGKNWDRAKESWFPDGPRTRDDRYVAAAIDLARDNDINSHFGVSERLSSYRAVPFDSDEELPALAVADFRIHVDKDQRIRPENGTRLSRELMAAWLKYHPEWVAKQLPVVVADAIQRLRMMRSEELAERRRKRKNVWRNGRRTKVNRSGPKPSRKLNLTCKSGLTKKRA
jgi:hypothetical protein